MLGLAFGTARIDAQEPHASAVRDTSTVVVECRLGEIASRVVEAHLRGDTIFVPADSLLALAGVQSNRALGEQPLDSAAALLHADVVFDPSTLVVQIADSGTLPVSRAVARARARAQLGDRTQVGEQASVVARTALAPSALTLDYQIARDGALALHGTSRMLGGALDAAVARQGAAGMRTTLSWASVPSATDGGVRIRVGALDDLAGGVGLLLTNAPLREADTVGTSLLARGLPAGSELELFDDGVLVAADSIGATPASQVQLARRRGTHVMRLVTYDSTGRSHEARWVAFTPDALLRRGALEYSLAAGLCRRRSCVGRIARAASIAYAPTDQLTLSAQSMPRVRDGRDVARTVRFALDASVGSAGSLSLRRSTAGGASALLRIQHDAGRELTLRTDAPGTPATSPILPAGVGIGHRVNSGDVLWALPRRIALDVAGALGGSAGALAAATSMPMPAGVLQATATLARAAGSGVCASSSVGAIVYGTALPRHLAVFRPALLRMRAAPRLSRCADGSSRDLLLVLPTAWLSALQLSASWRRGARAPALMLGLRREIGTAMRARAELARGEGAGVITSDVAGSIVVDGLRRGVTFAAEPGVGHAGVHGTVYVDENGNGMRDDGEPPVTGAVVRSGDASAVSDERGVFVLSKLAPDRAVRLSVDSISVEDLELDPGVPQRVVLTAGTVVRVDVPLLRRRELVP